METAPTGIDVVAAILCLALIIVGSLTLFGMGILMAINAIFTKRPLVTSWPADQESTFTPFELRSVASNSRAWLISLCSSVAITIVAIALYLGIAPEHDNVAKDMNMDNLTKKRPAGATKAEPGAAPAEAPKPAAPAEAPKPATPAEAPAAPKQ